MEEVSEKARDTMKKHEEMFQKRIKRMDLRDEKTLTEVIKEIPTKI